MTATDPLEVGGTHPRPSFAVSIPVEHGDIDTSGPWEQVVELTSDEVRATFKLYHVTWVGQACYVLSSILTFGAVALWCYWFPGKWIKWFATRIKRVDDSAFTIRADRRCYVSSLSADGNSDHLSGALLTGRTGSVWVVVQDSCHGGPQLIPVQVKNCEVPMATAFPRQSLQGDERNKTIFALATIQYRSLRWIWNPADHIFHSTAGWKDIKWTERPLSSTAPEQIAKSWTLSKEQVKHRQVVLEANAMIVPERSTLNLLVHEVLHPFTIFQVFSCIIWSVNDYMWYASAIVIITVSSIYSNWKQTRANLRRIRQMAQLQCDVHVYREGWAMVNCADLVPGDLVSLAGTSISTLPCDMLLISGDAIVDESMLTGESAPVNKEAAKRPSQILADMDFSVPMLPSRPARHLLYAGTRLIRVRGNTSSPPLGLAVRTGFSTAKGSLIRSMLHPKAQVAKLLHQDAIKYLWYMAVLGVAAAIFTIRHYVSLGASRRVVILRALDLLTIVIPPALPATLTAGISFALARLRSRKIFCTSPNHLNTVGQCKIMVFDKTGTLTEDGLAVQDVILPDGSSVPSARFTPLLIEIGMATCHDARLFDNGMLVGDPLDVKMAEWTHWTLRQGSDGGGLIARGPGHTSMSAAVLKVHEFDAALRRMSVITRVVESNEVRSFCKGAPENLLSICEPATVPKRIERTIQDASRRGLRVIAMASRTLTLSEMSNLDHLSRDQLEQNLQFLGLILFENPTKPQTRPALQELSNASIRCMMCTGDNVLTAISVARQIGMVEENECVYVSKVAPPESDKGIIWESADNPNITFEHRGYRQSLESAFVYAITGEAFEYMIQPGNEHWLYDAFTFGVVFARMSPDQKRILVEKLQKRYGQCVGYVGDGTNDVAALRAANWGLSLSEAEASIAAPFTSAERNVSSAVTLLKEGRAALVTSFSCFKFIAIYSLIQTTTVGLLYSIKSNLSDKQFMYIDLIVILPLALTLARSRAAKKLNLDPPPSRLFSKSNMLSIVAAVGLQYFIQQFMFHAVRTQPFYSTMAVDPEQKLVRCYEGTVLFFLSCFMYMATALSFAYGKPHRSGPTISFIACWTGLLAGTIMLAKSTNPKTIALFELVPIPPSFLSRILAAVAAFALVLFTLEMMAQYAITPAPCCEGPCRTYNRGKENYRQRSW